MDRSDGAAESLPGMGSQSGLKLVDDMSPPTSREWLILGYHRSGRGCRGASEAIRRSGRRSIAGVDRILRPGAVGGTGGSVNWHTVGPHLRLRIPAGKEIPSSFVTSTISAAVYFGNRRTLNEIGSPTTTMCTSSPRIRSRSSYSNRLWDILPMMSDSAHRPIRPQTQERYIKLGERGRREAECRDKGIVRFGFGSARARGFNYASMEDGTSLRDLSSRK